MGITMKEEKIYIGRRHDPKAFESAAAQRSIDPTYRQWGVLRGLMFFLFFFFFFQ
jgi:hypothetical protein